MFLGGTDGLFRCRIAVFRSFRSGSPTMKDAYLRFGTLVYVRRTEKTATNIRVRVNAFVGVDLGKAHVISAVWD